MEQNKRDNLVAIFLSILLAYLTYLVVLSELPQILSDYNGHTYVYLPMFTKESIEYIPNDYPSKIDFYKDNDNYKMTKKTEGGNVKELKTINKEKSP